MCSGLNDSIQKSAFNTIKMQMHLKVHLFTSWRLADNRLIAKETTSIRMPAMPRKNTKSEMTIPVELGEKLGLILTELGEATSGALARMKEKGNTEFRSTNYRNALTGLHPLVKFVRGFAGSSATAHIDKLIDEVESTFSKDVLAQFVTEWGETQQAKYEAKAEQKRNSKKKT